MFLEGLTDTSVVNVGELAALMRVSRWTISNWRKSGYVFEFGNRTTAAHCKQWLRTRTHSALAVNANLTAEISAKLGALA
jgi:hypothetical protein